MSALIVDLGSSATETRRTVSAGGLHYRVRPVLVELTEARLRDSHGIDLAHPRAATVVGDALWPIVRPDAPVPHDRMEHPERTGTLDGPSG